MSANRTLKEKQSDFIDVVGLVLMAKSTRRIALFRRGPKDIGAGHWEFPGGKVDDGESREQALVREINEELQFKIDPIGLRFITKTLYVYPTKKIQLFLYLVTVADENITFCLSDHDHYEWVETEALQHVNFSPADLAMIPEVIEFVRNV